MLPGAHESVSSPRISFQKGGQKAGLGKTDGESPITCQVEHQAPLYFGPLPSPEGILAAPLEFLAGEGVSSFRRTPSLNIEHRQVPLRASGLWSPTRGTPRSGPG